MGSVFLKSPEATSGYFARGGVIFLYVTAFRSSVACLSDNELARCYLLRWQQWLKYLRCMSNAPLS
jgi:hypothetical protein